MSSPILPIQDPLGSPASRLRAPAAPVDRAAFRAELQASRRALDSDVSGSPPAEVLEEIAVAGRTNEELRTSGRRVCFTHDENDGHVAIELRGSKGEKLRELSIAEALDLAAGKPLS
jgi:hypothetical protein